MALSKEYLETEITKVKATIEELEKGLDVNQLVLKAFQKELKK